MQVQPKDATMKFVHASSTRTRWVMAGLLTSLSWVALAQMPPADGNGGPMMGGAAGHHAHDPAKMAEHHAQHMAQLKTKLKLTADQEPAWQAFTSAMQPPSRPESAPMQAEMTKLTTPERIDKMQALRAQRDAEMSKRADATKVFYSRLTVEQKKVFDDLTLRHMHEQGGDHAHDAGSTKG
jgi:hypothetical protein